MTSTNQRSPAILLLPALAIAALALVISQCVAYFTPSAEDRRRLMLMEQVERDVGKDVLIGRPLSELVARYGEPVNTNKFPEWDRRFVICPLPGLAGIDHFWLLVDVDDAGRVTKAGCSAD